MIQEGDSVPEFTARDADGNTVRSSDFEGRRHLFYFYPKDFTPGCTIEAGEFSREYEEFKKEKIEIIGVSPDDTDRHKKFCTKMGIQYPLLADVDREISKAFGVWGMKKFMGKEYFGVIRSTFLVNEAGKIVKVYPKVKPTGHASKVLKDFQDIK